MIAPDFLFGCQEISDDDDLALVIERQRRRIASLETDNANLRHVLRDIHDITEQAPALGLPRSTRVRVWARRTFIQVFTKSLPRMTIIWSGAALIAYLVTRSG